MNNPYHMLARLAGHPDAQSLADDLTRWHDRMVAHVRRHGPRPPAGCCADDDDCPGHEASALWPVASRVFGQRARELTFLSRQAEGGVR